MLPLGLVDALTGAREVILTWVPCLGGRGSNVRVESTLLSSWVASEAMSSHGTQDQWDVAAGSHLALLTSLPHWPLTTALPSFRKFWGCGLQSRNHEKVAYEVLREEYRKLGSFSFAEANVLLCFILMVGLWFSRDPGFMPGWVSLAWEDGETK